VDTTHKLVDAMEHTTHPPTALVAASAVGFYGDRGIEPLDERSAPGTGFLAGVCVAWEREASRASALGIRTVILRTAIVLGREGGALPRMAAPFRFGAGGPLGNGRQFVPWIHIDDVCALYLAAVENGWSGVFNAVAPDYATSARLSQAIGAAIRRPALAYAPPPILRLVLGEFATTLSASQLALPSRAQAAGFRWSHTRLEPAVQSLLAPSRPSRLVRTVRRRQTIHAPISDVFAFFARAENLESITPPALRFELESKAGVLAAGSSIRYRLRLHGVPFGWTTLIAKWQPPHAFVDVQLRGPYALWEHRHAFEERDGATVMHDAVDYVLPWYPFSTIVEGFVRRDVEAIFDFRARIIEQRFEAA
ncbi:MAG: TIGR01777 family oxidoreductase, partial [Candidatus Tumulicola sp.]